MSFSNSLSAVDSVLDYVKLHFVILLWGLTAVLGNLVDLSSTQLVFIRSLLASLLLAALLRKHLAIRPRVAILLIGNGMLLGAHWILFFVAVKIASVSVCMIGMATVSFWTAILEPMLVRRVRFNVVNLVLGVVAAVGVVVIYQSHAHFQSGVVVAIVAAVLACLFSIFNGQLFGCAPPIVIVTYQMAGSTVFCAAALSVSAVFGWNLSTGSWSLSTLQWIWILILVAACTIYGYHVYIQLLERLSVFTINFANNLEPVYGIALGSLVFHDHRDLNTSFYVGAVVIALSVLVQPWLSELRTPQRKLRAQS
ncbi:EamA family transporter [Rhodopirellula sallentina]|uniref:Permease n=1 Tax=Rhodopirellula sallentina SM41 TaxID=1263870 RepID=M5U6H7_9BACT|nr:EamA family transporter [Rhodopirellula sallentina]EMI56869.1 permease [Rhodopirellula sallentina SM41]